MGIDVRIQIFDATTLTPKLGVAASIVVSCLDVDGNPITSLSMSEIGSGKYKTTVPDLAIDVGAVLLFDCGAGCVPRYQVGVASRSPMFALLVKNADGSLYSGLGSPSFYEYGSLYTGADAPDVFSVVSPYLFAVVGEDTDHLTFTEPVDSSIVFAITTGSPFIPPPVVVPTVQPPIYKGGGSLRVGGRDLAYDAKTRRFFRDSRNGLVLTRGADATRQACERKLALLFGEWFTDTTIGFPWLERVNVKNPNLPVIRELLRQRLLSVRGVASVDNVALTLDRSTRRLRISIELTDDNGASFNITRDNKES